MPNVKNKGIDLLHNPPNIMNTVNFGLSSLLKNYTNGKYIYSYLF